MRKKVKVVYVISTLCSCGPVKVLYNMIRHMNKEVFDINILTLSPENHRSRESDFIKQGVSIYKLSLSRIEMVLVGGKKFAEMLTKLSPDIIHSHGFRADYYAVKYGKKYCLCSTIHNYPHLDYPFSYGWIIGNIMSHIQIKLIKSIKAPIACSSSIAEELQEKFNINVPYIRNGVDISAFNKVSSDIKLFLKEKLNIPKNKNVLIWVGSLIPRKNPLFVIEAFMISKLVDNSILIMVGDGELNEECRKYQSEKIYFTGNVVNVNEYLNIADVFISASNAEGLPNAVLEAMATGLPVILSDIPPHIEIINTNPNMGSLFSLTDKKQLTEKLGKMDFSKTGFMGIESRKSVEGNFSDEIMSHLYQDYYIMMTKK